MILHRYGLVLCLVCALCACGNASSASTATSGPDVGAPEDVAVSAEDGDAAGAGNDAATSGADIQIDGSAAKEPAADPVVYTGAFPTSTGYATLQVAGLPRRVYVYVPANRPAKAPLVLAFHGTGGNVDDDAHQAAIAELGVIEAADANGFVVVAPQSTSDGGVNADHEYGGNGWRFDGDADSNADLLLSRAALQEARRVLDIDATHVYAVGHSNGAFFTYFVAMRLAARIAAFAENSGGLIPCGQRVDCAYNLPGATSCAALLAAAPSTCTCPIGASPFPTAKATGRVPQGFLKHNADDGTVSPIFTCRLAEHLGARATVTIGASGDHGVTDDFMNKAWAFLSARSLAD